MTQDFTITFWGVRGTVPLSGAAFARYGGNTSCVEVNCGGRRLVLDAGTGLHALCQSVEKLPHTDILLSHTHIDHIQGLPFFAPLYQPEAAIRIWAGHLLPSFTLRDTIATLFGHPFFPLELEELQAKVSFHDFYAGEPLPIDPSDGVGVTTLPLSHPGGATGYRINYQGKSVCYITDIEHQPGILDAALVAFVRNADLLIYDSTFDDSQFVAYQGWGHSTWQHAVAIANQAKVKTLAAFHHDPALDDEKLAARDMALQSARPGSWLAREGLVMRL